MPNDLDAVMPMIMAGMSQPGMKKPMPHKPSDAEMQKQCEECKDGHDKATGNYK